MYSIVSSNSLGNGGGLLSVANKPGLFFNYQKQTCDCLAM